MFRLLVPHLRLESVLELSATRLGELGLDALLLDVDCTLKRYRSEAVSDEVAAWLEELRRAGVGLCLLSNGRATRIRPFAESLRLPFLAKALKPLPFGCRAAVRKMGFNAKRTAMVGDQLFADVMAGRWAGLRSILVRPIHPEDEPWFTRMKRPLERVILRWMDSKPSGEN
ncbi:MAG: YqeG family HAD IIIA-type phosphatase [Planctomycetota bacterium]